MGNRRDNDISFSCTVSFFIKFFRSCGQVFLLRPFLAWREQVPSPSCLWQQMATVRRKDAPTCLCCALMMNNPFEQRLPLCSELAQHLRAPAENWFLGYIYTVRDPERCSQPSQREPGCGQGLHVDMGIPGSGVTSQSK